MNRTKFVKDDTYDFLKSFNDNLSTKIFGLLEILDEVGIYLGPSKLKKINKEIYELKIVGKISVRILLSFFNNEIFVLHAFVRKVRKYQKRS